MMSEDFIFKIVITIIVKKCVSMIDADMGKARNQANIKVHGRK